jgi:hypothetical protein
MDEFEDEQYRPKTKKKFQWGLTFEFKRAVVGVRNFLKSSDRVQILYTRIICQISDKLQR